METNKIDKVFNDTFNNRKLQPSNSAWDRLSLKLDVERKNKRKKKFIRFGYAASLLLLVSFTYIYLSKNKVAKEIPTQEIVNTTDPIIESLPKLNSVEPEITNEIKIANQEVIKPIINKSLKSTVPAKQNLTITQEIKTEKQYAQNIEQVFETKIDTTEIYIASEIPNTPKTKSSRFKIDPLLLLNSLESDNSSIALESTEVLSKSEKLKIILKELENKKLTISPEELLAEVEKNTEDKTFREKFLESIKNNISTLATAISERNK